MPDTRRCEAPAGVERPHTQDSWRPGASPPPLDLSYRGVHNESSGKTPSLLARPLTTSRTMALHAAAVRGEGFFPMESATRRRLRYLSAQQHAMKHGSWAHEGPTVRLSARRWAAPGETWGRRSTVGIELVLARTRRQHGGVLRTPVRASIRVRVRTRRGARLWHDWPCLSPETTGQAWVVRVRGGCPQPDVPHDHARTIQEGHFSLAPARGITYHRVPGHGEGAVAAQRTLMPRRRSCL